MNRIKNLLIASLLLFPSLDSRAANSSEIEMWLSVRANLQAITITGNQWKSNISVMGPKLNKNQVQQLVELLSDPNFGKGEWTFPGFKTETEGLPARTRDVAAYILARHLNDRSFDEIDHSIDANSREKLIRDLVKRARKSTE